MGTRQKLNRSYFNGSLLLAGVAGWLTESWLFFVLALLFLLGANFCADEIQFGHRNPRRQRPSTNPDSITRDGDEE